MKSNLFDLKKHDLPYDSFIGGWYIPENVCDELIQYYHENISEAKAGVINGENHGSPQVVKNVKDSLDLCIEIDDKSAEIKSYRSYLDECLQNYIKSYDYINKYYHFNVNQNYNIQKYPKGGGFKSWHFERSHPIGTTRILVFMTYLNDVNDGGTEFYYQKLKTPAKKGLTLIWPTDFTHTHRGIVSHTKEKYIVTGWFTTTVKNIKIKL